MFLIPLILGLGIVTGVAVLSKRAHGNPGTIALGPLPLRVGESLPDPGPMETLRLAYAEGYEIPSALVVAALMEAAEKGDIEAFREIVRVFPPPIALQKQSEESAPQEAPSPTPTQQAPASPLRGVDGASWAEFVARLRTQEPSFRDARHVGAYYHNTQRLSELGIDPSTLTDESTQYQALETDIKAVSEQCRKLINDWAGDLVQINGQTTPVTFSGLLGLIKAAGVEGAKQWLTSEESRLRYPNTTKQFLNTNGLF